MARPDCIEPDAGRNFGECGARSLVVHGPLFNQTDISIRKRTQVVGHTNAEFAVEMLNAFNRHYFGGPDLNMSSASFGNIRTASGGRTGQLGARLNW